TRTPGNYARPSLGKLVERIGRDTAGRLSVAGAQLDHAATMCRATHDAIGDAELIHDVERGERHMRRLEDITAGVEHKIRRLARLCSRAILQAFIDVLTETRKLGLFKLHARENIHAIRNQPKIFDTLFATIA